MGNALLETDQDAEAEEKWRRDVKLKPELRSLIAEARRLLLGRP